MSGNIHVLSNNGFSTLRQGGCGSDRGCRRESKRNYDGRAAEENTAAAERALEIDFLMHGTFPVGGEPSKCRIP